MFDLSGLLISAAMAQEAAPEAAVDNQAALMNFLPFVLIFAIWIFLVIRPQQKKMADQEKLIKGLKVGDRVVTSGGMYGKINKIDDKESTLMVEIAEGVHIKINRDNILSLEKKPNESKDKKTDEASKEGEKK